MSKDLALQQVEWDLHNSPEAFIPLEFTQEIKPGMYGLEPKEANQLVGGIDVITAELKVLKDAYIDVIALEINTENLPVFKDLRKNFTKNRTSREKLRKDKKSYFLNGGRFVDAIFKNIDAECEFMESKLLDAEKFFENIEKQKAKNLNDARIVMLAPYGDFIGMSFAEFSDEDFDDYFLGKKTKFENAQKEAEAEALRIETEKLAESKRQKAIETENAKLKAKVEAQRKDNARIAIELQDVKDTEIKAENARLAQIEADKKAPVKKQIEQWVNSFQLPECTIYNATSLEITEKFQAFKKWSLTQVNNL